MNIRNLFLMSMVVCTSPVVCVDRLEVSLTKQEQKEIKRWAKTVKTLVNRKTQQWMKAMLALDRNRAIFELSKMYVEKCVSDLEKETNEADKKIFDSREKEMDNTLPKGRQGLLAITIFYSSELLSEVEYARIVTLIKQ